MSVAALHDVEVDYGQRGRALGPFSLSVAPGEIVALVGPSGCGKSTALRLLAGLERPTRGEVVRAPGRGETAVVFQAPTLAPWLSACANVALPLELAGTPKQTAAARATEALGRVGLAKADAARPAQLSGGMAMRVSLARALVTEPKLLLLDEPFAALDEITRQRLDDLIHALWRERRFTALFVTHSLREAVFLAQRAIMFSRRPAHLVADRRIEFPIERGAALRSLPAYNELVEQLHADLLIAEAGA